MIRAQVRGQSSWRESLSPLSHAAFRRLWLGLLASRLGDQFTTIALLWFVLTLTGSGAALGIVALCFTLPAIVTGPLVGWLLDRYQPRAILAADNLLRALLIGAIPALYAFEALRLWQIYALTALAGALAPATQVGARVLVPQFVPDDELERANALVSVSVQFPYLIGPVIAGLAVAILGGPWTLLVDAASFVIMGAVAWSLPRVKRATTSPKAEPTSRWLGFGALLRLREVGLITALTTAFFLAYGLLEPALPLYSRDVLHAGAAGYGLLWTAYGAGMLVGLLGGTPLLTGGRPGVIFASLALAYGVLLAPLFILRTLPVALLFFALAGCAWGPYTVIETALLQRLIPPGLQGQVFGARSTLTTAAVTFGPALGGALLEWLPASTVIGFAALGCVATGMVGLLSPALRRIPRKGGLDPES
jgi:MFS family permease